jgi:hypothetical protein
MNGTGAEEPRDAMRHIQVRALLKLPLPLVLCTQLYAPCNRCKLLIQILSDKHCVGYCTQMSAFHDKTDLTRIVAAKQYT